MMGIRESEIVQKKGPLVKNSECTVEFEKKVSEMPYSGLKKLLPYSTTLEKWCSMLLNLTKCTYQLLIANCGVEKANKALEEKKLDQLNRLNTSVPE